VHIRFEDNMISRKDFSFNFGLMADEITYSMTDKNFHRIFLNIDDKIQQGKSFSMLKIDEFAVYWSSAHAERGGDMTNWSINKEFVALKANDTIEFSKRHTENLKRKYYNQRQDNNQSSVFLI
jgi:hypothetical protein